SCRRRRKHRQRGHAARTAAEDDSLHASAGDAARARPGQVPARMQRLVRLDEYDATALGTALLGVVSGDGRHHPGACSCDALAIRAVLRDKCVLHRSGAAGGEVKVVVELALAVGVADDEDGKVWIVTEQRGDLL